MRKKFFIPAIFLLVFSIFVTATPALAVTVDELKAQIAALQSQIAQLITQLAQMQGGSSASWCHTFNTNLGIGSSGSEVVNLQTALTKDGARSWEYKGYDGIFDEMTASAVVGFQEKYKSEILSPYGLTHGTGYVGKSTRAKLNKMYGCSNPIICPALTPPYCPAPGVLVGNGLDANGCSKPSTCVQKEKSITVTSPNGDRTGYVENITAGQNIYITWDSQGVSKVKISVCGETPLLSTKYTCWEMPGMGYGVDASLTKYNWYVDPNAIYIPGRMRVRVSDFSNSNLFDESDNYFSIIESTAKKVPPCLNYGDVDNNGYVEKADSDLVLKIGTGLVQPTDWQKKYADVSGDGTVSAYDSALIQKYVVGTIYSFAACNVSLKSITVVSPNGGEKWQLDQSNHDVAWSARGAWSSIEAVTIYLRFPDGLACALGGASASAGKMTFELKQGGFCLTQDNQVKYYLPGNSYKIMVMSNDKVYSDLSDSYFSITAATIPAITPTDSDNSPDYTSKPIILPITQQNYPDLFVAGIAKGIYAGAGGPSTQQYIFGQEPNPLTPKPTSDNFATYYDHCFPGTNQLNEAYVTSGGKFSAYGLTCPNGCSKGACLPAPATVTCTDSDQGKTDYYTKGTTTWGPISGQTYTATDSCDLAGSTLSEMYCSGGYSTVSYFTCPNGCLEGACLPAKSISIAYPNGGETWVSGQSYFMKWSPVNVSRVVIDVIGKDGKAVYGYGIPSVVSNVGSYLWQIPSNEPAGEYKVRIVNCPSNLSEGTCANTDLTAYGYGLSDNYFSIINPNTASVKVSYPNGGETINTGGSVHITWQSQGIKKVNIYLTNKPIETAGGFAYKIATGIDASLGSYDWAIPSDFFLKNSYFLAGNNFRIGVYNYNGENVDNIKDGSDANFSLVGTSLPICTDTDNGIKYDVQGTVDGLSDMLATVATKSTDYCSDQNNLVEYSCGFSHYRVTNNYTCPNGCANGACLPVPVISSDTGLSPTLMNGTVEISKFKVANSAPTPMSIYGFNFITDLLDNNPTLNNLKISQVALYRSGVASPISDIVSELGVSAIASEKVNINMNKSNGGPMDTIQQGEIAQYVLKATVSGAATYDVITTKMSDIKWNYGSGAIYNSTGVNIPISTWSLTAF